jgi:hypothetical protein
MKSGVRVLLLAMSAIWACCSSGPVANSSQTPATSTATQPTTSQTAANNDLNTTSAPGNIQDEGLRSDFQGTAGITEKKNDVANAALLTAVRSAQQGNFDRIVFQFAGTEVPSYHVEYVDRPVRTCGSGEVVPLRGDAWLEIRFTPANAHSEEGRSTVGKRQLIPNHKIVKELRAVCDFEAVVEWVAGVASPNRYRVIELKDPSRIVVDIKH